MTTGVAVSAVMMAMGFRGPVRDFTVALQIGLAVAILLHAPVAFVVSLCSKRWRTRVVSGTAAVAGLLLVGAAWAARGLPVGEGAFFLIPLVVAIVVGVLGQAALTLSWVYLSGKQPEDTA